jgi:serine protease Do
MVESGGQAPVTIGIRGADRGSPQARARVGRTAGLEVVEVIEGSPAARAGLRPEDLIVELGGRPVERADDIQRLMNEAAIDQPLTAQLLRGDRWLELQLQPVELVE